MKFLTNLIFFKIYFLIILFLNFCQSKRNIFVEFFNKTGKSKNVQIEIENNPFGKGAYAWVYFGRIINTQIILNNYGKRISEIVVKINKNQKEDELEISNEIKILEEFNKLPIYEREGIIELYLHGQTINSEEDQKIISQKKENKNKILYKKVLILEYGGVDLRRKIDQIRENFYEEEIWFLIQKTLLAVKDMHRLIMHLDLKPDNMVYTSNDLIKIIDFGSGQFIQNEGVENDNNKLANYCKLLTIQYTTQVYRGPENNIVCDGEESGEAKDRTGENKLSTKADIWSMGIIILEYILNSPSMKGPLEMFRFLRGNITTNHRIGILQILKELNFFYKMREKKWNKRIQVFSN
uniref:Protein kinase domain-containing protein n=1 Tax=Meloidogyne enterolobii TaxID=390850 RepID=A0A6V7XBN5_MELEN|nr:unnamed protein product [Meloidogyne enterolobii]